MLDASRRFDLPPHAFAEWEIKAVYGAVHSFVSTHGIPGMDRDDLAQEAFAAWFLQRRRFNARRSPDPHALLNTVIQGRLTDLLRAALAEKRGGPGNARSDEDDDQDRPLPPRTVSLDAYLDSNAPGSARSDIVESSTDDPTQVTEQNLLAEALLRVAADLPPAERELLDYMARGFTAADVARLLNVPESSVRSQRTRLIKRLRATELRHFVD
jgi:RNA polymerase sigma factor (sigma-70 family)